ncbi:MAG: sigma-70 family RNA polymerase sigma factor [Candidatus Rokuibacteriota bacterium]
METAEQLFQAHSGWVYGYCLRVLRSPEEAEDALQTTYLNACRSLSRGTRPKAGSAWLLRIAQNVCFARLRASGRRGKLERVQDVTVLAETVPAPERTRDEMIGLIDALATLPERQRRAILLREWQGLSYGEVARTLGITQAAVESLIFRARRSLAAALEDQGTRGRRKALHALDLGGLLAAIKGLFAGSAGVKAVAAVAVATATTATVVATDPAGVRRDPHAPVAATAQPQHARPSPSEPTAAESASIVLPDSFTKRPISAASEPTRRSAKRGRAFGQATAAAAKAKDKSTNANAGGQANGYGNGQGKALGHAKQSAAPASSNGQRVPAGGRPDLPEQAGPPPHAKAKGAAKKAAKSSN